MKTYDLVIIGGGPAGLSAAVAAKKNGIENMIILERDRRSGGILNQCIHSGFGLHRFKEELTGPEYAARYRDMADELGTEFKFNTMVTDMTDDKVITYINREEGLVKIKAEAVILAMGCRERPRGALTIPGYRPAGIYSAGTAQYLTNIKGILPGKKVVILGSGDIGLIMARRMVLEGAEVKAVAEVMPYSGGLQRNIVQCLEDFNIPLMLSHTVVEIKGKDRVEGVVIAEVDENRNPVPGTEEEIECDTLLLSVGLIPENELSKKAGVIINPVTSGPYVDESFETNREGIFACGNVLHVHDLVDFVSYEGERAGENAASYIKQKKAGTLHWDPLCDEYYIISAGNGIRYTVPSKIDPSRVGDTMGVNFRTDGEYRGCRICASVNGKRIMDKYKLVMVPGQMEKLVIDTAKIRKAGIKGTIEIFIEEMK